MMSPRWRKVIRDLWGNKARTLLVVMAIAVGVFAFGSVFITQEVLLRDMNQGYAAIHPAHAVMGLAPFDEDMVSAVKGMRSVDEAEGRSVFSVKLQVAPNNWVNLDLNAVPDYNDMRLNLITPESGTWPPARREVLIERASIPLTHATVGDMLHIELPNGEHRDLRFAGTVHDFNAIPATLFPQGTGYISMETLEWLGQPRLYTQLLFTVAKPNPTKADVEEVAKEVTDRLAQRGITVGSSNISEPGKHWASDVTKAFTAILSGIGVFSLILSGFLVVNTISAILAQQKRQIGMMKAVGAVERQVMGVYLVTVAIFGILALFVAVPIGMGFAWLSIQAIASFLNITIVSFRLPMWVLGLQLVTALIVPIFAAFFPILAGTRTTVREAVSDYGIGRSLKTGLIDRMLGHVRGLPRPTLLSLRNTFRRKGRLYLTLGTLTVAGAVFISIINCRAALMLELDKIIALFNYDVQMVLGGQYSVRQLQREAARVEGVTSVEGWSAAQVKRIRPDGNEGATITLFGPPADTKFIRPTVLEGRWITPDDQNAVVVSLDLLREEPDLKLGDTLRLKIDDDKRDWIIVGIIDRVGQPFAYTSFNYLSRIQNAPGYSSVLMVGTSQHDGLYQSTVSRALEEHFKHAGIQVGSTLTLAEIYGSSVGQFNFLIGFMLVMAVLLAVVGALGLAGTMSLNVLERTREIGVMRAIGASDGMVGNVVVTEGILIGLISWFLGAILSAPISYGLGYIVGVSFMERSLAFIFDPMGLAIWLVIVLILSLVASFMPARSASRISVRDALAYE